MPKDVTPLIELKQEIKAIEKKMDKLEVKYAESQKEVERYLLASYHCSSLTALLWWL